MGEPLSPRWLSQAPLFVVGGTSIVAGGFAAAVTRPADWELGSWVAAFLVLVTGAGQVGIGAGQAALAEAPVSTRLVGTQCAAWTLGGALVITGTVMETTSIVAAASVPLVAVLVTSDRVVRSTPRRRFVRRAYRSMLGGLLISIPIGLGLSWIRH